jgi:hypothetical protein
VVPVEGLTDRRVSRIGRQVTEMVIDENGHSFGGAWDPVLSRSDRC